VQTNELIWLAIAVFTATNVDDLVILLAFFADARIRPAQIALGQYVGIAVLVVVSIAASLLAFVIPPRYIGLLGVVPIAIGIAKLWQLQARAEDNDEIAVSRDSAFGNVAAIAGITVANGGDNIAIYVPVFATRNASEITIIVGVFALMIALWLGAANWLVSHRTLGEPVRRYGRVGMPFVLIALGIFIVYESQFFTT